MRKRLAASIVLIMALLLFGCSSNVTLKDWENSEETVFYGSTYEVRVINYAEDEKGNQYPVDFVVLDSSGNEVELTSNKFIVTSLEGYTVKYLAKISKKDVKVKEIKLNVSNKLKPSVSFTQSIGDVVTGVAFELPAATATDISGKTLTVTYKLYKLNDEERVEIPLEETSVTLTQAGQYQLEALATDQWGNVGSATLDFVVQAAAQPGEIQTFTFASSVEGMSDRPANSASWLATFQGKEGIAKLVWPSSDAHPRFYITPRQEKSHYEQFTHIVFRMYIEDPDNKLISINLLNITNEVVSFGGLVTGEWYDYALPINKFLEYFDYFTGTAEQKHQAHVWGRRETTGADIIVYIDEIFATNYQAPERPAPAANEIEFFGERESINNTARIGSVVWLEQYKGKTGVLKLTNTGKTSELTYPAFYINPRQEKSAYENASYVVFRIYIVDPNNALEHLTLNSYLNTSLNYTLTPLVKAQSEEDGEDKWTDYYFPASYFLNAFDDYINNNAVAHLWGRQKAGADKVDIYVDSIRIVTDPEITISGEDNIMVNGEYSFSVSSSVEDIEYVISVTDPDGENVTVTNNKFTPNKVGKYTIKVTHSSWLYRGEAEKEIQVAGVYTVNVGEYEGSYKAGQAITLLEATITDQDGNTISTQITIKVKDSSGNELTVTNGSFTPDKSGIYTVIYTAEVEGAIISAQRAISVDRKDPEANEVEFYDDVTSVQGVGRGGVATTWLEEYKGSVGVLKIVSQGKTSAAFPGMNIKPRLAKSAYENADYVVFRLYIVDPNNMLEYLMLNSYSDAANNFRIDALVKATEADGEDKWTDYYIPASYFLYAFDDYTQNSDLANFWGRQKAGQQYSVTIYVDSIRVVNDPEITITGEDSVTVNSEYSFSVSSSVEDLEYSITVTDPDGETVTVTNNKFTPNKAGKYTITVTHSSTAYYGVAQKEVQVAGVYSLNVGEYDSEYKAGQAIELLEAEITDQDGNTISTAVTVKVKDSANNELTITDGSFTPDKSGIYTVIYTAEVEGAIISAQRAITVDRKAPEADEVEYYDDPVSAQGLAKGPSASVTYLESYKGATGVIKLTSTTTSAAWPGLYIKPRQEKAAYENADYIAFRMYIVDPSSKLNAMVLNNYDAATLSYKNYNFGQLYKASSESAGEEFWKEYYAPAGIFLNAFDDYLNNNLLAHLWFTHAANSTSTTVTIYLDSIRVVSATSETVMGFDQENSQTGLITENSETKLFWLETYEDATGVARIQSNSYASSVHWINIFLTPEKEKEAYENGMFIVVRVFISDPNGKLTGFTLNDTVSGSGIAAASIGKGGWYELVYDITPFLNHFEENGNYKTTHQFFLRQEAGSGAVVNIYIDEIRVDTIIN
jgi:hypothetical protein